MRDAVSGTLFFCDEGNNRIRRIAPDGRIYTYAGGGADANPSVPNALNASLNAPFGIAADAAGNVYFTEKGNGRVRRIALDGTLTTLATLTAGTTRPLAIDRARKLLWVGDGNSVRVVSGIDGATPGLSPSIVFTATGTAAITGLSFDQLGTLYLAQANGDAESRIFRLSVDASGLAQKAAEPVAGSGGSSATAADYAVPSIWTPNASGLLLAGANWCGLHVDTHQSNSATSLSGILYAANSHATANWGQILRLIPTKLKDGLPANYTVSTYAGDPNPSIVNGNGTAARFNFPRGTAVDASGNLYIADVNNHVIRKVTPAGDVTTFAGTGVPGGTNGPAASAQFYFPQGVAVDATGNVYVVANSAIRKITPAGDVSTLAGSTSGYADGSGTAARFNTPHGVAVDAAGNVYVGDTSNHRIRKITPAGAVTTLAGSGTGGYFDGGPTTAQFSGPRGLAVDGGGNLYVADMGNSRLRKVAPDGTVSTLAGGAYAYADGTGDIARFRYPTGVALDGWGKLYVVEYLNHCLRQVR